jgi:Holliday junction resolvase RusA-like endonuclease
MKYIFDIDPKPAPRMVRSDKWAKRPIVQDNFSWRNALRLMANTQGYKLSRELHIIFVLPMPESWSEKKKRDNEGCPHMQRPDLDNLIKNWQDTFTDEDGYIYKIDALKLWGRKGQIIITENNII